MRRRANSCAHGSEVRQLETDCSQRARLWLYPSLQKLTKYKGKVPPELLGINSASTFTGFCSKHDTQLFAPLETEDFRSTFQQCFLLGYRAFAREVYTKKQVQSSLLSDVGLIRASRKMLSFKFN